MSRAGDDPHDAADHEHGSELSETQLRVRALESILVEKGYVDPAALDVLIEAHETQIGPHNGARVVAKAWVDPGFRQWLLTDSDAAIASLGYGGRQGEAMVALENTASVHNLVVCTLCSCYPVPVLGLPPVWYKSAPYRSRAVADPAWCSTTLGWSYRRTPRSVCGIPPRRCAIWSCRCARRVPTAGGKRSWPVWSRGTR